MGIFVDDQSEENPNQNIKSTQSHFCDAHTDLFEKLCSRNVNARSNELEVFLFILSQHDLLFTSHILN